MENITKDQLTLKELEQMKEDIGDNPDNPNRMAESIWLMGYTRGLKNAGKEFVKVMKKGIKEIEDLVK